MGDFILETTTSRTSRALRRKIHGNWRNILIADVTLFPEFPLPGPPGLNDHVEFKGTIERKVISTEVASCVSMEKENYRTFTRFLAKTGVNDCSSTVLTFQSKHVSFVLGFSQILSTIMLRTPRY